MKRSRFTEEQIIGILRGAGIGGEDCQCLPQARDLGSHFLQVQGQVWRHGRLGCPEVKGVRRRERQAEEAVGRDDAG